MKSKIIFLKLNILSYAIYIGYKTVHLMNDCNLLTLYFVSNLFFIFNHHK